MFVSAMREFTHLLQRVVASGGSHLRDMSHTGTLGVVKGNKRDPAPSGFARSAQMAICDRQNSFRGLGLVQMFRCTGTL
jgi:hypothetical protein